jgi:outer membrane protein assembly factor BamD (BamD/ComL family)
MLDRPRITFLAASLGLCAAMTGQAAGQNRFTLTEDDQWLGTSTTEPGTPADRLAAARRALARGQALQAEQMADDWITRHPRDPMLPEAYLVRADALVAQNEEYKALFDYEYVVRAFPGSEAFVTALQRELDIARLYATGKRRKLWGIRMADASDEAEELFIRVQERLPGSRLAEEAGLELGDFYFRRRNMPLAAEAYALFIENYPRSAWISKARRRLIYAHLAAFKGPQFDATGLREAATRLRELQTVEPATAQEIGADALHTRIDESHALKLLVTARWYRQTRDYVAAELTIRRLIRQYPTSVAAADGLRLIPEILPHMSSHALVGAPDYEALRASVLGERSRNAAATAPLPPDRSPAAHPDIESGS